MEDSTRSDALVLFGATGDLARKMVLPALYRMTETGRLDVPVIGVALSDMDPRCSAVTPATPSRLRSTASVTT